MQRSSLETTSYTLDVCITSPLSVDPAALSYWLEGYSVAEAARELTASYAAEAHASATEGVVRQQQAALSLRPEEAKEMWDQLVLSETAEQYRLFAMLRPCLDEPAAFASQAKWFAMLETERRALVDAYYTFDARVMREMVGRRPTSKLRRQLEAQADRLNVTTASCRRQFDNLQRLYEHDWDEADNRIQNGSSTFAICSPSLTPTEPPASLSMSAFSMDSAQTNAQAMGAQEEGIAKASSSETLAQTEDSVDRLGAEPGLVKQMSINFMLSQSLSSKYVRLLFLANHQFDASKRRLQQLAYADWDTFAASLLLHWASPSSGFDLDFSMVRSLRAIKASLADQRASAVLGWPLMQQAVLAALPAALGRDRPVAEVDPLIRGVASRMRPLLKGVVEICGSLSYPRELRDLFVMLADVADTLRAMGLIRSDAAALLSCITRALPGHFPGVQAVGGVTCDDLQVDGSAAMASRPNTSMVASERQSSVSPDQNMNTPTPTRPVKQKSAWEHLLAAFSLDSSSEAAASAGQADAWQRFLDGATPIIIRLMEV